MNAVWRGAAASIAVVSGVSAWAQTIERVNVSAQGGESSGVVAGPGLSADGRKVVFSSPAADLVERDENGAWDVFVRDLASGATRRVSVSSAGVEGNADSGLEAGPGECAGAISSDGRYVVFISAARNLIAGETDPDGSPDVFVHELSTGTTRRLAGMTGARSVRISPTGDYVFAFDGVEGMEWSRATGAVSVTPGLTLRMRSRDGVTVADSYDNCVRVGPEGSTHFVFGPSCMAPTDARLRLIDLSDDGLHVVTKINYILAGALFESCVYGPLPPPSVEAPCIAGTEDGEAGELWPAMSPSGYLYGHTEFGAARAVRVFERDPAGGEWRSLETGVGGAAPDGPFGALDISDTGVVAVVSSAANLVEGDGNGAADLFIVRGLAPVKEVEVQLEVLIDASSAVTAEGYTAMVAGVRGAIEDPEVFPSSGAVAVRVAVFDQSASGGIGWTSPDCPCDVPALAARASEAGDLARPAGAAPCLVPVLERESALFGMKRYTGGRRVVLVVGAGQEACASAAQLAAARDRALGRVDEIHAVVLDGGGAGTALYESAVVGPGGTGFVLAGAADYSDAGARIKEAVGMIVGGPWCPADVNRDGMVDYPDYLEFLKRLEGQDCRADLNRDCIVDFADVLEFLQRYDGGC